MDFIWRKLRTLGVMALLLITAGIAIEIARPHAYQFRPRYGMAMQPHSVRHYLLSFHEIIALHAETGPATCQPKRG